MHTREGFENNGFTNEYGKFIDNPRISDIIGSATTCIMGFTHIDVNWHEESLIRETQSDSAGNLLPDDWNEGEWRLTEFEYFPDTCVADALDLDDIEEVEDWGLVKLTPETLKNPESRGDLITLKVEDRASSADYDYDSYEYKFFVPDGLGLKYMNKMKQKYKVTFEVYVKTEREIYAESEEAAWEKADELYDELDPDDFDRGWDCPDITVRLVKEKSDA